MAGTALAVFILAAVSLAITIAVNSAVLWLVLKLFKFRKNPYRKALKTAAYAGAIMFFAGQLLTALSIQLGTAATPIAMFAAIPLLTWLVNSYMLARFYRQERRKAAVMGIAWTVPGWVISGIVSGFVMLLIIYQSGILQDPSAFVNIEVPAQG